jgi:hypothetical protein
VGFLDQLPTLAEARQTRCARPKGAEPSRLQKKVADAKDEQESRGGVEESRLVA